MRENEKSIITIKCKGKNWTKYGFKIETKKDKKRKTWKIINGKK